MLLNIYLKNGARVGRGRRTRGFPVKEGSECASVGKPWVSEPRSPITVILFPLNESLHSFMTRYIPRRRRSRPFAKGKRA
jgi:hypothetical protein